MLKNFLAAMLRSPISMLGVVVTTVSAMLIFTLFAIDLAGFTGSPYIGILAFLVFPAVFVLGLIIIPIGILLQRRKERRIAAGSAAAPSLFPVIDLNQDRIRKLAFLVSVATVVNLIIIATATYKGVEVMESTKFCGTACHSVMAPEFTAYSRSPHARVKCVDCHIGPGADWFVKSKLSGSWQLISVALKLYPRPIPVPVHNLRPARETCEQCHWPTKFVGDRLKVITTYDEDEKNTEKKTVAVVRVGGTEGSSAKGIHWHVGPGVHVRYKADDKRENIGDVQLVRPDGSVVTFKPSKQPEKLTDGWRTMDCVDCHNRPTHVYFQPSDEMNRSMREGRIDHELPFVRREGLKLLTTKYTSHDEAKAKMRDGLLAFYAAQYPEIAKTKAKSIEAAAAELGTIYTSNVWPSMNIEWGTYPSFLGHSSSNGCFRCHDEDHKTEEGRAISQDCTLCHSILATEEKDPKVLKDLEQKK